MGIRDQGTRVVEHGIILALDCTRFRSGIKHICSHCFICLVDNISFYTDDLLHKIERVYPMIAIISYHRNPLATGGSIGGYQVSKTIEQTGKPALAAYIAGGVSPRSYR